MGGQDFTNNETRLKKGPVTKKRPSRKKWMLPALILLLMTALLAVSLSNPFGAFWAALSYSAASQKVLSEYGAPPPQVGGLYWGMSPEALILTLNLQSEEYTVTDQPLLFYFDDDSTYGYHTVKIEISERMIPTPQGMSCPTTFYFYEREGENSASIGLTNSSVCLDAPIEKLIESVSDTFSNDLTGISTRFKTAATVGTCLPDNLRQSVWDSMLNPSSPQSCFHNQNLPSLFTLLEKPDRYDQLLSDPIVTGEIRPLAKGKTAYFLDGTYPAIFHMLSENQKGDGSLPWDINPCFGSVQAGGTASQRRFLVFLGLSPDPNGDGKQETVWNHRIYLNGIELPARQAVIQYDPFKKVLVSGKLEWFLSEETELQALIQELARHLSESLWEEADIGPNAEEGILHQWDDDFGNHLYLQNDPENGAVRMIVRCN